LGVSKVNHLTLCKSYDEFLDMGRAKLNIVLSAKGIKASKEVSDKVPFFVMLPTYSVEQVISNYRTIFQHLGKEYVLDEIISATEREIRKTVDRLKGSRITVGSTATERPFALARALSEYGFRIDSVFHSGILQSEKEDYDWLMKNVEGFHAFCCEEP
jgi:nitrogenase molybdenum-iron protein alpha/beta subunit